MAAPSKESILTISDLQHAASIKMRKADREFYNEGASDLITLKENEEAFNRYMIRPRILRNVENVDTTTTIMGSKATFPLGYSPAAMHRLAHPDGEIATSKAAATCGIPMALSTWATASLEDVISCNTANPYIMQITLFKDRTAALDIIRRAEKAGYKALFVTVDTAALGRRLNEMRNGTNIPEHLTFPNMQPPDDGPAQGSGVRSVYHVTRDPSNHWESVIPWLKKHTSMEIWLKGIYDPEDAQLAAEWGVDGILVSNHGGRQLDGAPATLDLLPDIVDAVGGKIQIAIDGGIRRGSDIFKALALGAQFCFVGRIPVWGLAYNGEDGVRLATQILLDEFKTTMTLAGCARISDISKKYLVRLGPKGLSRL